MAASLGQAVRHHWGLRDDILFLNHGSYGATPKAVLAEQRRWQALMEENPVNFMRRVLPPALAQARVDLARFLRADPGDLGFVENATGGVNAVLRSLDFAQSDEILVTSHGYNAVKQTVHFIEEKTGAAIKIAEVPFPLDGPGAITAAVTSNLSDRTRLVILDHITSPTATIQPLKELIAVCKSEKRLVLVDGAHAPGMLDLDVPAIGADFYTGNCHKWLCAPKGCAFLWVAPDRQTGIHPTTISHPFRTGFAEEFSWTGTRDASASLSVGATIGFFDTIGGLPAVRAYCQGLATEAAEMLSSAWGTPIGTPASLRGSMAVIGLPERFRDIPVQEVLDGLWERHRIEVPVHHFGGDPWVRISAAPYNHIQEYEVLRNAVLAYSGTASDRN
ncbi:aminotransferase class V-fold PLP-dependent enzyme [Oceanibaculum indicum]|uniref:Isopenicillin-N epimerase n=1 Tax=Oceanibaculum indicum TaxID=526216 RepID=A0A420WQG0_9PROT|nr:aminotransferase class V-fold PLP-dependent enzyme [Oceanibaculum indicum]RKQ73125.1 isopenicillin-N epimerase [Oceanibaculum indicum]